MKYALLKRCSKTLSTVQLDVTYSVCSCIVKTVKSRMLLELIFWNPCTCAPTGFSLNFGVEGE